MANRLTNKPLGTVISRIFGTELIGGVERVRQFTATDALRAIDAGVLRFQTLLIANTPPNLNYDAYRAAEVSADIVGVTTLRVRTSNVATLTIGTHNATTGQKVNVSGVGGTGYNGTGLTITATTATTISYASVAANEGSTADTGGTVDRNGQYTKALAYGLGSWTFVSALVTAESLDARLDVLEAALYVPMSWGGTANAMTGTSTVPHTAYDTDSLYYILPGLSNTSGIVTINVNAIGAIPILWAGPSILEVDDIEQLRPLLMTYRATPVPHMRIVGKRTSGVKKLWRNDSVLSQSAIASPSTRYTEAASGEGFTLTQSYASTLLTGRVFHHALRPGETLIADFVATDMPTTGMGPCIGITPSVPALDYDNLPASSTFWQWRGSGVVIEGAEDAGGTVAASIIGFDEGDVLTMAYTPSPGAGGLLRFFQNGVPAGWHRTTTSGFGQPFVGMKGAGPAFTVTPRNVYIVTADGQRVDLFVDVAEAADGIGSRHRPYNSLAKLNADPRTAYGDVTIHLRGQLPGAILLASDNYASLRIIGDEKTATAVVAAQQVTSGWTQDATYANVWYRTHYYADHSPALTVMVGATETTVGCAYSPGLGSESVDIYPYATASAVNSGGAAAARLALNSLPATHFIETTNGIMYLHARGSVNPNTLTFQLSICEHAIAVLSGGSGNHHTGRFQLANVDVRYGYWAGVRVQRMMIDVRDCGFFGAGIGNGISPDECVGTVSNPKAAGNKNDGLAPTQVESAVNPPGDCGIDILWPEFWCNGGDGCSPHTYHTLNLLMGSVRECGKDGASVSAGNINADGTYFGYNLANGVNFTSSNLHAENQKGSIQNCIFEGNNRGINATLGGTGPAGSITVLAKDNFYINNVTNSVLATATDGTAPTIAKLKLTLIDEGVSGAVPSSGHRAGNGTYTLITSTAMP